MQCAPTTLLTEHRSFLHCRFKRSVRPPLSSSSCHIRHKHTRCQPHRTTAHGSRSLQAGGGQLRDRRGHTRQAWRAARRCGTLHGLRARAQVLHATPAAPAGRACRVENWVSAAAPCPHDPLRTCRGRTGSPGERTSSIAATPEPSGAKDDGFFFCAKNPNLQQESSRRSS